MFPCSTSIVYTPGKPKLPQPVRLSESQSRDATRGKRRKCMGLGFHSYTKAGIIPQIAPERELPMPSENVELRRAGLKVTLPRIKILQILESTAASAEHLSAEDVYQRLRDMGEDVGLATVYRVLTQFETAELVTRHNFEGGHSVFELSSDDHHDHMVDVDTNDVIEFYDEVIEKRQHEIAKERGFEIIDHSLVLYVRKSD